MSEAKWYVVHTYSGYENKVKANIDKTIETRHLEDQILEVRVPLEEVPEIRNGVEKVVQRKMFPGYVMIHMIMNDDTWYVEETQEVLQDSSDLDPSRYRLMRVRWRTLESNRMR